MFKSCDAAVGDILRVELLDYSGVLADCLQGAVHVPQHWTGLYESLRHSYILGHKERSADVSDTSWESRHFTFDVVSRHSTPVVYFYFLGVVSIKRILFCLIYSLPRILKRNFTRFFCRQPQESIAVLCQMLLTTTISLTIRCTGQTR